MTFQYIVDHLGKPHSWYVVLTGPHVELDIKRKLEQQGFITYVPFDSIQRHWAGRTKKIHIPTITRCVLGYKRNMSSYLFKPLRLYIKANKSSTKT